MSESRRGPGEGDDDVVVVDPTASTDRGDTSHSDTSPTGTGRVGAPEAEHNAPVPRSRIIFASLIGTTIEFYDFYIFATAAVSVFPLLFFAGGDSGTALLASMATFGTAFIARPLGSIIFGHYGDRLGRKVTLVGALLTMGIATFLIGLLPTI